MAAADAMEEGRGGNRAAAVVKIRAREEACRPGLVMAGRGTCAVPFARPPRDLYPSPRVPPGGLRCPLRALEWAGQLAVPRRLLLNLTASVLPPRRDRWRVVCALRARCDEKAVSGELLRFGSHLCHGSAEPGRVPASAATWHSPYKAEENLLIACISRAHGSVGGLKGRRRRVVVMIKPLLCRL